MSHYSGHVQPGSAPQARVAFFGISLVAVGLLGFYTHQVRRHERKHAFDRAHEDRSRVSSWEHRMLQRGEPIASASSPNILRAARIEGRSSPLPPPKPEHNARHRTVREDGASSAPSSSSSPLPTSTSLPHSAVDPSGRPLAYDQPTAQKGHSDGRPDVYTKNPGWREQAHYATGGKTPATVPPVDGELQKMQEVAASVKEKVNSLLGRK